jgi:hypothetical protein
VGLRDPSPEDANLILNSWLKSHRDVGDAAAMTNKVYYGGYREECIERLRRGFVTIACSPRDPDTIYGWICWSPGTVHYLYVKHSYRQRGVAKALGAAIGPIEAVTTIGRSHREWALKYKLEYDPYSWMKLTPRPEAQ